MSIPLGDCYLDHIAIATNDLEQTQKVYEDIGFSFLPEREIVLEQGVETAFATVEGKAKIELLYPHGEDGPIHRYLEKKGPGIHHLCFRVNDLVAKSKELEQQGYKLLYPGPKEGAHRCLVNFIHPKSTGGVLIELSEKMSEE